MELNQEDVSPNTSKEEAPAIATPPTKAANAGRETTLVYYIDDEEVPFKVKIPKPSQEGSVILEDFKKVLPAHLQKHNFFFKSQDTDYGTVKAQIIDDEQPLPFFDGKIVAYLVATEGSMIESERGHGVGQTRPPSFHGGPRGMVVGGGDVEDQVDEMVDDFPDSESAFTSVSQQAEKQKLMARAGRRGYNHRHHQHPRASNGMRSGGAGLPPLPGPGIPPPGVNMTETETASSMMSSELESSIYEPGDSQSEASSRITTTTDSTHMMDMRHRQKKKSRRRMPAHLARAGSMSSVSDSTISLNIITVTLNMDTVNFLGISIVGQINGSLGDVGIYVGSIMKGGAVALDGRIEPGDMILQVNDISFENMSNDDAAKILKEVVQKPGPVTLVVSKCWDPKPSTAGGYLGIQNSEPVRPIDPGAWVAHTAAVRDQETPLPPPSILYEDFPVTGNSRDPLLGDYPGRAHSATSVSSQSLVSSQPETEKYLSIGPPTQRTHLGQVPGAAARVGGQHAIEAVDGPLTTKSGMNAIMRQLRMPGSGLEVKDRTWLKLKISNAFLGSDLVEWLNSKVDGFQDRREARKFAVQMLKNGFIKDTVNKSTFSEQCYYTFGSDFSNLPENLSGLNLNESKDSAEHNLPHTLPAMTTQLPMGSGGSGGSGGGIWGASMPPAAPPGPPAPPPWEMPWTGPPSGGSTTTYGPIYNPSAPPPSQNYVAMPPYQHYPTDPTSLGGGGGVPLIGGMGKPSSGSESHSQRSQRSNNHLRLAGSGSGSESASNGSEKGSLLRNQGLRPVAGGPLSSQSHPQPVFQTQ